MLNVDFCGIKMKNPFVAASGTFGFGPEYKDYLDLANDVGAISVKGLTLEPRTGNKGRRIAETPSGVLNCIGLENPGAQAFIDRILPTLITYDVPIIANISGRNVDDYKKIAELLSVEGVAAFEVNISCPNVANGGMAFGVCPDAAAEITEAVRNHTDLPVITKLSPNVTNIVEIALAVEQAGAHGLSMINTLLGMAVDWKTWRPVLGNVYGGLSGPAIKPITLRMIHQVSQAVSIPIMGGGGIMTGTDAVECMLVGARTVSIGAATMVDPRAIGIIARQLDEYMKEQGLHSVEEIIGQLKPYK